MQRQMHYSMFKLKLSYEEIYAFSFHFWSSTFTVCDIYCCPVVVKCNYIIQLSTFYFEHLTGNRSTLKMITSRHSRGH